MFGICFFKIKQSIVLLLGILGKSIEYESGGREALIDLLQKGGRGF